MRSGDTRQVLDTLLRLLMLGCWMGALIAGAGTALWGWRQRKRDTLTPRDLRRCRMLLNRWGYLRAPLLRPLEETPVPQEMALRLKRVGAWQEMGAGTAIAVGCLVTGVLAQATTGNIFTLTSTNAIALMMLPVLVAAVVIGPVTRLAVRKAGVLSAEAPDPLPYRRSWLSLFPALLVLADAALTLFLAPRVLAPYARPHLDAPLEHLPGGLVQVCAVALVVAFAAGEYTVRLIARLPRLRLIDDPALAARVDGNWRTTTIRAALALTYVMMGGLGIGTNAILLDFANAIPTQADLIGLYTLCALNLTVGWICLLVAWGQRRLRLWPPRRTAPALGGLEGYASF